MAGRRRRQTNEEPEAEFRVEVGGLLFPNDFRHLRPEDLRGKRKRSRSRRVQREIARELVSSVRAILGCCARRVRHTGRRRRFDPQSVAHRSSRRVNGGWPAGSRHLGGRAFGLMRLRQVRHRRRARQGRFALHRATKPHFARISGGRRQARLLFGRAPKTAPSSATVRADTPAESCQPDAPLTLFVHLHQAFGLFQRLRSFGMVAGREQGLRQ